MADNHFKRLEFDTPLGQMVAIASDTALHVLLFSGQKIISDSVLGDSPILQSIKNEIDLYFSGKLKTFKTPLAMSGTDFQKNVWKALLNIPFGKAQSYLDLSTVIGKPTAFRAAAQANGANKLAIIIPCHRVINHNGKLGGYNGGLERKEWLLKHENHID